MKKTVIIQASSRSKGDTSKIVEYIKSKTDVDVIDLRTKNIGHYDYDVGFPKNVDSRVLGKATHKV
ncbi:hypothetical protein [uncultured Algibacter sp.]|uniref:hypothetical protein n=1 Tax=uncultured Algibacter sp. TaxID=298659 RepID=UPI0026229759|nr:hypothetical protein [uncultured Algibacter sp.]